MRKDPYQLLGLAPSFDLNTADVEAAYLARVAHLHPDRADGPVDEGEAALHAAELNDARQTLLDPERRARALLEILGGSASDDALPEGFLMEIMEVRMELEQAAGSNDQAQVDHWLNWADERRQSYMEAVAERFRAHQSSPDESAFAEIRKLLNAWRYIERMIEQAGLNTQQKAR